jgi:hypothetical protein
MRITVPVPAAVLVVSAAQDKKPRRMSPGPDSSTPIAAVR